MTTVDAIIPAQPGAIRAASAHFRGLGTEFETLSVSTEQVPELTPTWEGYSDTAFEIAARKLAHSMKARAAIYSDAGDFLEAVAEIFEEYRSTARLYVNELAAYEDDPTNLAIVEQNIAELRTAGQNVADHAATELLGILDGYTETAEATGGPESEDDALQPVTLTREENLALYALLQGDGAMDYTQINQGAIGNCYLLASIISMMSTDEGADFIRDSIRPIFSEADGEIIGWEVRTFEPDYPLNPFDSPTESW